jgi:hypothetical protein
VGDINHNQVLLAFADDPTTAERDGFNENELMSFKMFRSEGAIEAVLDLTWENDKPQMQYFAANGISAVESLAINSSGSPQVLNSEISIYPNPGSGIFFIDTQKIQGMMDITITDTQGETVFSKHNVPSSQGFKINLSNKAGGIYILRISSKASTFAGKILLIKK